MEALKQWPIYPIRRPRTSKAAFEGEEHQVHIRVAEHAGDIYIDIGDASWRAIKGQQDRMGVVAKRPR